MDFAGKTAFVTGAASGIGRATALAFANAGAKVAVLDRNALGLREVVTQIVAGKGQVEEIVCDLTDADAVYSAITSIVERWGTVDCAVNAAGVEGATNRLVDEDEDLYQSTVNINLRSVWICMRAQIGQMLKQGGGTIVNISSGAGLVGSARSAIYSATKHAVIGLTRSAALQYARDGVRINVVCPSGVQTPMAERIVASFGGTPPSEGGAKYPLGRYSTPEEIASGILWLSSPGAASAIGSVLTIDAGFTAA